MPINLPLAGLSHLDRAGPVGVAASMLAWAVVPEARGAEWLLLFSKAQTLYQLARGSHIWVLNLGYARVAVGLSLLGASIAGAVLFSTAALHALTAGAIGALPLAMMSGATLGHTGRPLTANGITTLLYLGISGAALLRVSSPALGEWSTPALHLCMTLWVIALAGFAVIYALILFGYRTDGTVS